MALGHDCQGVGTIWVYLKGASSLGRSNEEAGLSFLCVREAHTSTASMSRKDQKHLGHSSHTTSVDGLSGVEQLLLNWPVTAPQRKEELPYGTGQEEVCAER